jgi:hypothetical protein
MSRAIAIVLLFACSPARADLEIAPVKASCAKGAHVIAAFAGNEGPTGPTPARDLLDEDIAREHIEKALAKAGLKLERGVKLERVSTHYEMRRYFARDPKKPDAPIHDSVMVDEPLAVDGYDAARGIGFVFLGRRQHAMLRDRFSELPRAWNEFDFRRLATLVQRAAQGETAVKHLAIFYDPSVPCDAGDECKYRSLARLNLQIEDFLTCLRAAGAM